MGQNTAGKMAEVVARFIGPKRRWSGDGVVRGTAGGASSTCQLRERRRGRGHLMRGK
jgi:hypothetical protein